MALPLPQVVSDVGPGGPLVTGMRGANALANDWLTTQYSGVRNQYAPYNLYADALSKIAYAQYLPYQLKAQALSNPLLWMALKDNPDAAKAMFKDFSSSIPNQPAGTLPNGAQIPVPGQSGIGGTGNGLLSMFLNKIGLGGSQETPNASQPSRNALTSSGDFGANNRATDQEVENVANGLNLDGTPRTPATSGGGNALIPGAGGSSVDAVTGRMTAPYNEQVHKAGISFVDPNTGQIFSAPTNETVTAAQNAINAAKRVEPQLKRLADAAGPFLSATGEAKNLFQQGYNYLFNPKNPGKLPTQYAEFQSLLQSAPEALVKAYGLRPTNETIERMQKVIEPVRGETKDQYRQRIANQLESIRQEQIGISSQQLSHGFDLGGGSQPATPVASTKTGVSQGAKMIAKDLQLPQFESKEQFQAWYSKQSKIVQDAVKIYLGKKR